MDKVYKIPESVLVIVHTSDLQVLLIERADKPGYWQSITGSKDRMDEPLTETAVREVWEETGIVVGDAIAQLLTEPEAVKTILPYSNLMDWKISNVYEIYSIWGHRYAPGVTHNTEHVFSLLVPREIPITLSPREHLNYIWLPYQEAAKKCFSASNAEAVLQLPRHVR